MKNEEMQRAARIVPGWAVALCLLISLAGIADHELWTPDEPREAALSLEMSESGNIIIPALSGEPFVEKPPLYYIIASSALTYLGPYLGRTATLRLVSALLGLGALGFTWLLARRLMSQQQAIVSVLILATMPGFVQVTHWLLVDNALLFFIMAAFWALAEAYIGGQQALLLPAALFAACAFLSKGLIGPVIIWLGWLGLLIHGGFKSGWRVFFSIRSAAWHFIALLLFCVPCALWAWEFRQLGGPELFNEWFWVNHLGRFSGNVERLGHINGPFYYAISAPLFTLPWIILLILGLIAALIKRDRRKELNGPWPFLLAWGLGGLILFSLSATKRDIYLIALLPAFAMMTAIAIMSVSHRQWRLGIDPPLFAAMTQPLWARLIMIAWLLCLFATLAAASLAPLLAQALPQLAGQLPATVQSVLSLWQAQNSLALVLLLLAVLLILNRSQPFLTRWFASLALTYIALLTLLCPIIDRVKNYGPAFERLAKGALATQGEVVLWNPDETTRAGFYYYCGLAFPSASNIVELASVLDGTHPRFSEAIVSSKNFPPEPIALPWKELQVERMGPNRVLRRIAPAG